MTSVSAPTTPSRSEHKRIRLGAGEYGCQYKAEAKEHPTEACEGELCRIHDGPAVDAGILQSPEPDTNVVRVPAFIDERRSPHKVVIQQKDLVVWSITPPSVRTR